MIEFLWITQAILFLFYTERYLRENDNWDKIYKYLGQGAIFFVNWRADADIIREIKVVPELFQKLAGVSFLLILILIIIGINSHIIIYPLLITIGISFLVLFSFKWVFNHSETIKEFKPMAYFYGAIGIIILFTIFQNNLYPSEIMMLAQNANIILPTQSEVAINFIFAFLLVLLSYYLFMWLFALAIPTSILIILFTTTKVSKILKNNFDKKSINGFIGIVQLLIFYGFYRVPQ